MRFKQRFERTQKGVELTRVACDLCGKNVDGGRGFYDQSDVEIQAAIGKVYPEGDSRERTWIDCCPACFEEKVMPAIEALGVKFRREPMEKSIVADDPYPDAQWEPAKDVRDASNARIAALPKEKRGEAMRRASRSYSVPETCVRHDGCRIEGGEVVWPDGERWPARPTS